MADSYEVVLQQVALGDLFGLLKKLEENSKSLSDLTASENIDGVGAGVINEELVDSVIAYGGSICLTCRLHRFSVSPEISLPIVLLRVVKYQEGVDVELSFDESSLFDIDRVMFAMKGYCNHLLSKFYMSDFYGGLEPAVDVGTRYFTGNSSGPLG